MYTANHSTATVTVVPVSKNASEVVLQYRFNGTTWSFDPRREYAEPDNGPLTIEVRALHAGNGTVAAYLRLEDADFLWDHPPVAYQNASGDYRDGRKGAIVELFGWRHIDIEQECKFIAAAGYLGVKFFPVMEQVMSSQPYQNVMNPWYFMYQPVSYRLQGRMGTRDELRRAINVCRSYGVRAYADAVVNHMTGNGNDGRRHHRAGDGGSCTYWGEKNTSADFPPALNQTNPNRSAGSSPFFTQGYSYLPNENTGLSPMQEFPAVPYGPTDFHCERALNSWTSPLDLNAGWLVGLVDLNTEKDSVRQRIADYMTDLLSIGFSGFRVDAAKHIRPEDWGHIFGRLKSNLGGHLPEDFLAYLEVLTGGEGEMLLANPDSGYSYSKGLEGNLSAHGLSPREIESIKIWFDAYPKQPGIDDGELEMTRKAIENDDVDQQTQGSTSRDMGSDGTVLVIAKDIPLHRHFEKKLFYDPNGASDNDNDYPIRLVLSSFWLPENPNDYGMPDGNSDCIVCSVTCTTCDPARSVNFTAAYRQGATAYDTAGRFTRVHRDGEIINAMRWWMHLPPLSDPELNALLAL